MKNNVYHLQSPEKKLPKAKWLDLLFGQYSYRLHPDMLLENGHQRTLYTRIVGMSKSALKREIQITFDEGYILNYLIHNYIKPMHSVGLEPLISLLVKAWDLYRQQETERLQEKIKTSQLELALLPGNKKGEK